MRSIIPSVRLLTTLFAVGLAACAVAPQGDDDGSPPSATTSKLVSTFPTSTSTSVVGNDPGSCQTVHPACTLTPFVASEITGFAKALSDTHECGTLYHYQDNVPGDYQHIGIALCNDTSSVRGIAKPELWPYEQPRVVSGVCDKCLSPAPSGKIYVEWKTPFYGPTCGSSCSMPW